MIPLKEAAFKFGDIVFHKTDGAIPGVITAIVMRPSSTLYEVTWQGREVVLHFDVELAAETDRPKYSSGSPDDPEVR